MPHSASTHGDQAGDGASNCPSSTEWSEYLNGIDDDALQDRLERHLTECGNCQRLLDHGPDALRWSRWERLLDLDDPPERLDHSQPARASLPGEIPGIELLEEIGRGGMGVVYRARQSELGRIVAVKMLLGGALSGPERLARFRTEAEAAARLRHPNIVQIYSIGEHAGLPYLTLEYVDGPSLAEVIKMDPVTPRPAAELVATLAIAMHHAHLQKVVHRDLKPTNILLAKVESEPSPDNYAASYDLSLYTPKIADFSLARHLESDRVTHTAELLGTPNYMAPEQARGEAELTSPALDIYALGAILYEMLTGCAPFEGGTAVEVLHKIDRDEPTSPRRLLRTLPRDLETIVLKCLEKSPARRYHSALALANDLRRFLEYEHVEARPVGALERAVRWCRRRPAVAVLTSLLVLAVIAGGSVATYSNLAHRQTRQQLDQSRYIDAITLAKQAWTTRDLGRMRTLLDRCPPELRRWEWGYLRQLAEATSVFVDSGHGTISCACAGSLPGQVLTGGSDGTVRCWNSTGDSLGSIELGDPVRHIEVDPASRRLLAVTTTGRLIVRDSPWDEAAELSVAAPTPISSASLFPGGKRVIFVQGRRNVHIRQVDGERSARFVTPSDVVGVSADFEGDNVYTVGKDGTVTTWNEDGSEGSRLPPAFPTHGSRVTRCFFSPSRDEVATCHEDRIVRVYRLSDGKPLATYFGHAGQTTAFAFSRDGLQIATAGENGSIKLWESTTNRSIVLSTSGGEPVTALLFDPDGRTLIACDTSGAMHLHQLADHMSHGFPPSKIIAAHADLIRSLQANCDSQQFASTSDDQRACTWDATTGALIHEWRHPEPARDVAFNDDSSRVATICEDGRIRIWDNHSGTLMTDIATPTKRGTAIAYSSDGRWLAAGGGRPLNGVYVYDTKTNKLLFELTAHTHTIRCLRFDPTSKLLVTTGGNDVYLWDVNSGMQIHHLKGHSARVFDAAFSPDGRTLVTAAADGAPRVWDVASGQLLKIFSTAQTTHSWIAFHPAGDRLALVCGNLVRIVNPLNGHEVAQFHSEVELAQASFVLNGARLVVKAADHTICCWDAR